MDSKFEKATASKERISAATKILSWNTRGLIDQSKQLAIKQLLENTNPNLVLIQESKRESIELDIIKAIWSSKDIGWDVGFMKSHLANQIPFGAKSFKAFMGAAPLAGIPMVRIRAAFEASGSISQNSGTRLKLWQCLRFEMAEE
ncbi:hypothetical protein E5676_scaffold1280G00100 [Cucumis melo var. makuwa]|uniref:Endonuclease/exonuclease/phosphatase domain-containing protein n=1 Tax=Cucumis melo var. makuwa TaxID=1194695 RepID=A0A5A7TWB6_CUCMM|nr:hypothetical protein E6C27_scaffold83G00680 [Cucumis melo var. makuwa]TYK29740.1 hypothetical protein E5676_scaffold1280G00100 [Cucumis melo var. makuwa]